ncbi:MAG: Nucleoside-diphosphate-sugar epimerase [Armatimonadetes bacterium]|nr:Nucleoside-diphosphate-sugar epimerase [Armatimonadota bacterium]
MTKTALVTGGAGFIGGHLVRRLLTNGWRVRVLDNFSSGLRTSLDTEDVELIEGDIRDVDACRRACRGVDSVFHLAAIASVASSVADPIYSHDVNVNGTLNMLMAARDGNARRFVLSSSASVYGNAELVPTPESAPLQPQSPYATGKACGEMYCRNFWELYGLETVILRYFNVFGPGQNPVSGYAAVIPQWIGAATRGERPVIYGDGRQTRDFVFVGNVAAANARAAMADGVAGMTFNVAGGEAISLLRLIEELEGFSGRALHPEFRAARAGEVRHSRADITQAREQLRFLPEVSFQDGLRCTYESAVQTPAMDRYLAIAA